MSKFLVILPVYNEEKNLELLIPKIINQNNDIDILIVDDGSCDGSLNMANKLRREYKKVFIKKNNKRYGRGLAVKRGYIFAINRNYDYVIEMDADFSHRPEDISVLIKNRNLGDIIIGSRLVNGTKVKRSSKLRNFITKYGNIYLRWVLNLKNVNDITSGFRCISVKWLKSININSLHSHGPQLLQEIIYKNRKNVKIKEVPITYLERYKGKSKFNLNIILKSLYLPLVWKIKIRDN